MKTALLLAFTALALTACQPQGPRCVKCGMPVADHPRWHAGATLPPDQAVHACCPRCLLVWLQTPAGQPARDPWITEYYTQQPQPLTNVWFILGSDLTGPMGPDLVPVADRAAAEQFLQDHHGQRLLRSAEVTPSVLQELLRSPR